MQIICKDWRDIVFGFGQDRNVFYKTLKECTRMTSIDEAFAFANRFIYSFLKS
jgi:hypothetical protein